MTSDEKQKAVIRLYIEELWNNRRFELIDTVLAPDLLAHNPDGTKIRGNQRFREVIPRIHKAFPDLHLTIEDMITEGDKVACRLTLEGTHQGEFAGILPTQRRIKVIGMYIMRLAEEKIVEYWWLRDQAGLLQQLQADK
jgi:steroid delta-isomerase-like uncharacterized protein